MNLRVLLSIVTILVTIVITEVCKKNTNYSVTVNTRNLVASNPIITVNDTNMSDFIPFYKDDFNGSSLNTSMWSYFREGDTVFNSIYKRKNVKIANGQLYLITDSVSRGLFTAANISTEMKPFFHSKYGYYEIRAKLPRNYGNGAAFWIITSSATKTFQPANPTENGTEIDIFEYSATQRDRIFYSLHWNGYGQNSFTLHHADSLLWLTKNPEAYHTYALKWTPKEYVIYVDNVERARTTQAISRVEEFVILGCGTGGFAGDPLFARGPWPDTFAVDYIKVDRLKPMVFLNGDCGYTGWLSEGLEVGEYTAKELLAKGVINNQLSAIELPRGWVVTLFDNDNLTGDSLVITHSISCLDAFANDKASSIRVRLQH